MKGVEVQNIGDIPSQYRCSLCELLLRNPIQLICGHRQCKLCTEEPEQGEIQCFKCKQGTPKEKMFVDRAMANDMETLSVTCYHCSWAGQLKNYQMHLSRKHSNGTMLSPLVVQLRRLHGIFKEYEKNVGLLKAAMQQFLADTCTLTYQISIEEQTLPEDIHQENENCFIAYHGTLFIRIDNARKRLKDSAFTITSPPFYTSQYGYKLCVRLQLNGNATGQSTHLSAFVIILRGEYDALLEWPCSLQVIFCLYDLTNQKEHLIESFQSDINSPSFQRPQSERNTASGLSNFLPLSKIDEVNNLYLFDNRLYFKVMVRRNPIPVNILSNVVSINPGLPVHIQEELIQQEIEKQPASSFKLVLTLKPQ